MDNIPERREVFSRGPDRRKKNVIFEGAERRRGDRRLGKLPDHPSGETDA
jgi:hypothetical protein